MMRLGKKRDIDVKQLPNLLTCFVEFLSKLRTREIAAHDLHATVLGCLNGLGFRRIRTDAVCAIERKKELSIRFPNDFERSVETARARSAIRRVNLEVVFTRTRRRRHISRRK
jgi:hypothetical protein